MSEQPTGENPDATPQAEAFDAAEPKDAARVRRPEELEAAEIDASLDLYDREFDASVARSFEERYAEQERRARYAQAAEPHGAPHGNRQQSPDGSNAGKEPFAGIFRPSSLPALPSFPSTGTGGLFAAVALNPWGYVGILGALVMPILGLAFGYLGLRKGNETDAGLLPSKIAIGLAAFTIAMNFYFYLTGGFEGFLQGS